MRKNNTAALAFVALVWTVFLLLMAHHAYKNLMNVQVSIIPSPKTMGELLDGNR